MLPETRYVLDAVGSERAAFLAITVSAPMSMLFAATYPERLTHLVLHAAMATLGQTEDTPWGLDDETRTALYQKLAAHWGEGLRLDEMAPSADEAFKRWYRRLERYSASPGSVLAPPPGRARYWFRPQFGTWSSDPASTSSTADRGP